MATDVYSIIELLGRSGQEGRAGGVGDRVPGRAGAGVPGTAGGRDDGQA